MKIVGVFIENAECCTFCIKTLGCIGNNKFKHFIQIGFTG